MDQEGITSVAVVDSLSNVVGNISTVDVKVRSELYYKNPRACLTAEISS